MLKNKKFAFLTLYTLHFGVTYSQTTEIKGKITASSDIDRIHVINKTANQFTITNDDGEFKILAAVNDSILISDDLNFLALSNTSNDIQMLEFLKQKLKVFKLQSEDD